MSSSLRARAYYWLDRLPGVSKTRLRAELNCWREMANMRHDRYRFQRQCERMAQ
jgi:hypothetical protein